MATIKNDTLPLEQCTWHDWTYWTFTYDGTTITHTVPDEMTGRITQMPYVRVDGTAKTLNTDYTVTTVDGYVESFTWINAPTSGQTVKNTVIFGDEIVDHITIIDNVTVTTSSHQGKYRGLISSSALWQDVGEYSYQDTWTEEKVLMSLADITINDKTYTSVSPHGYEEVVTGDYSCTIMYGNRYLSNSTYYDTGDDWAIEDRSHDGTGEAEKGVGCYLYTRTAGTYTVSLVIHQATTDYSTHCGDKIYGRGSGDKGSVGHGTTTVGYGNRATGRGGSIAIGRKNLALADLDTVIGIDNTCYDSASTVIGTRIKVGVEGVTNFGAVTVIGNATAQLSATNHPEYRVVGAGALAIGAWTSKMKNLGPTAGVAGDQSVAIGKCNATHTNSAVALGTGCSSAGQNSLAMGLRSNTCHSHQVVLGYFAGYANGKDYAAQCHPNDAGNKSNQVYNFYSTGTSSEVIYHTGIVISSVTSLKCEGVSKTYGTDYTIVSDDSTLTFNYLTFTPNAGDLIELVWTGLGPLNTAKYKFIMGDYYEYGTTRDTTDEPLIAVDYTGNCVLHSGGGVIIKDDTNGNYYKIHTVNGVLTATAFTP